MHFSAGLWPAGGSRPRRRRGPGVQPFTPDPSGPLPTGPTCHRDDHNLMIHAQRGRTDRDAQRAGRWGDGSAQCAPPCPGRNHDNIHIRAILSRASRPARSRSRRRERALAGCSGGASGPCRPGLKPYRKLSPPEMVKNRTESYHRPKWLKPARKVLIARND